MKIYLAGPLFTAAERLFNKQLQNAIQYYTGHEVVLPQESCQHCFEEFPDWECVFRQCKKDIDECLLVLAVLDGADADSGTCWEAGYAYGLGKPVIGIRTDLRPTEDATGSNAMLSRSCRALVKETDYEKMVLQLLAEVRKFNYLEEQDATT